MKKKILTLTFTLILLIGLVAAVGMNAGAATTYTARNRLSYVNTADNLWNYVAQSYTGDVIALSGNITYDDKNDADPYILPFGAQGDMVLDLNGYTLDITTRADALIELDYGTTRLHIINSRPDVPAKIIMRTKVGNSSMIDISKKECGVYVYKGVELVMGKEGDTAEAYKQTSVISATEFSDIAVYGGNLTNNIANGVGIVLESDNSLQFDNSTVTLHGGAIVTAKTSSIFLHDAYDYPTFNIGDAYLECDGEYYAAISNYIPAASASSQVKALTFVNIVANGYSAYLTEGSGRLEGRIIASSTKLLDYNTKGSLTFKLTGVTTVCNHNASTTLLNSFFGHYDVCTKCYKLRDASGEAKIVTHTYKEATSVTCTADGYSAGYDCGCGYKTITKTADMLGHDFYTVKAKEPTCTESGTTSDYQKCTRCASVFTMGGDAFGGAKWAAIYREALGHDMKKVDAVTPTCTKDGNIEYYDCSRCDLITSDAEGKNELQAVALLRTGHKEEKIAAVAATCTKTGLTEGKKCSVCGTVTVAQQTVAKKAHTYKDVTTKATLTKNGKIENKCSDCGKVKSTTTVYYPKTIKLSKTEYTYNGKVQTPSVTVKDSKGNTLKKDTDYTVKYESGRKATGTYTVTVTFKGKYSGTKKLTYTIAPKATSKITAAQSTKAIKLTWNKVTGADGYRVYQYNAKTKKWDSIKTTTSTSFKVEKLKAGTVYKFKIKAYKKDDGTIWGKATDTFTTATKCKTPSITKLTTTKGKAVFTWSDVSGESGYQVYYSTKKDSGFKRVATYKADVIKGSKSKLTVGKTYYFKVRAYTKTASGTVYSDWSAVKSIKIK